jgi:hypothetical protein
MTLLYTDGFEEYPDVSGTGDEHMGSAWWRADGVVTDTTTFRSGSRSAELAGSGDSLEYYFDETYGEGERLYIGFDANIAFTAVSSDQELVVFKYGLVELCRFVHVPSTKIYKILDKAGTTIAATDNGLGFLDTSWAYLEFMCEVRSDSTGIARFRVNGNQALAASSFDTDADGFGIDRVRIESAGLNPMYIDNLYICDGRGDVNNGFLVNPLLGRLEVDHLPPAADGHQNDGQNSGSGTNAEHVDETAPNNDTDYIYQDADGEEDYFTVNNLPAGVQTDAIKGVMVSSWTANANPTDYLKLRHMIYVNSVEISGGKQHKPGLKLQNEPSAASGVMYPNYHTVFEVNDTGGQLSAANVDAIEVGVRAEA